MRDTTQYGHNCLQSRLAQRPIFASLKDPPVDSEDCLSLNVWTPGLDGKKRPVMVWMHGGGYIVGSGNTSVYEGHFLAKNQDVVVVNIVHRLNIFGYFYLGHIGDPRFANSGNQGQLDLIAALEWVRDNIANFGGDPGNVTIFGESSGGGKVCALLAMPSGKDLYKRAIVQSGPMLAALPKEVAAERSAVIMKDMGLAENDIEGLQKVPGDKMIEAVGRSIAKFGIAGIFTPVVNGTDMPRSPFAPDASPVCKDVTLLIGCTKDEGTILASLDASLFDPMAWEDVPRRLSALTGADPAPAVTGFRKLYPDATPNDIFFTIASFLIMRFNTTVIADRKFQQGGAPVYSYLLTWPSPVNGGRWGATHTVDVPLMFDNLESFPSIVGPLEESNAQPLASVMSKAWAQFARSGDPSIPELPHWPEYDDKTRQTMVLDLECKLAADPSGAERAAMGNLLDQRIVI